MDKDNLLEIDDLVVSVDGREILHGLNLAIKPGETNVIFGPNGGGKNHASHDHYGISPL